MYYIIIILLLAILYLTSTKTEEKLENKQQSKSSELYDCGDVWELKDKSSLMLGRKTKKCSTDLSKGFSYKREMKGIQDYSDPFDWEQENALIGKGSDNGYLTVDPQFKVGTEPKRKIFELTFSDDLDKSEQLNFLQ